MLIFKLIYWAGLIAEIAIRAPYQKGWKTTAKTDQRVSLTERVMFMLLTLGGIIFPLLYTLTGWLDFANYSLPAWMGWLGVLLLALTLYVFVRAHRDLKSNWSPTLEIYQGHSLVTGGIYGVIRHPMYASQWLLALAQLLLLQNWLAGPVALLIFIPFYFLRVPPEEKMMLDTFGEEYKEYMNKTGRILPKF